MNKRLTESDTVAQGVSPIHLPALLGLLCAGYPHRGIFYVLNELRLTVLGDIECYTQTPTSCMESPRFSGASVSGLHDFLKSRPEMAGETVAVIDDSLFTHGEMTPLANMTYDKTPATVIILDNPDTVTECLHHPLSDGEPAPQANIEALCREIGIARVRVVDPYDLKGCKKAISEELGKNEPSVIIARRPCALPKAAKNISPLVILKDECRGCKRCMGLGCPALSPDGNKTKIDPTLCVGCGLCQSLCNFGAIHTVSKEEV